MPRWPAGLHLGAGSVPSRGQRPQRADPTRQQNYWRRVEAELHAGANAVFPLNQGGQQFLPSGTPVYQIASVGPQGAGETWRVTLVRTQMQRQYALPPLVTQQISAQVLGTVTSPPPPLVAQVWLSIGGTLVHLLAQTTQGGNDTVDIGGQVLTPGEAIAVQFWSTTNAGFPGFGWIALRGTRYALSAT